MNNPTVIFTGAMLLFILVTLLAAFHYQRRTSRKPASEQDEGVDVDDIYD